MNTKQLYEEVLHLKEKIRGLDEGSAEAISVLGVSLAKRERQLQDWIRIATIKDDALMWAYKALAEKPPVGISHSELITKIHKAIHVKLGGSDEAQEKVQSVPEA